MPPQLLLYRVSFHLAILAAITCQTCHIQTAWCQTIDEGATAPSSKSVAQKTTTPADHSASSTAIEAVTVDPNVTTAHLKLFVKPLTVDELEVEAKGWQNLLKKNVEEITAIQIRIEKTTAQIATQKASTGREPHRRADESQTANSDENETQKALGGTAATNQPRPTTSNSAGPDDIETGINSSRASTDKLSPLPTEASTTESLTEQREQLFSKLTELNLHKTEISEKFEVVLSSLEIKGGDPDEYQKYNDAVSGVALEVTDAAGVWQMFTNWLVAEQGGKRWVWNLVRFIIILLVSYFGASMLANFVHRGASRVKGVSQLLVNFLSSFTKQLSMVVGFIIGLAALEIDITPLIAAVGAAGFVIAFALQGTLSNFASGLLILAYRPFDVGDVIEAAGVSGKVDSVSLFSTHIRTFDNKLMIVPNNDIWGGTITNATASPTRRVDLVFGIGYGDDIDLAKQILEKAVQKHALVLKDPAPTIRVNELADSSVNLICRPWTLTENYWSVYWDLMQTVKQEFDGAGVSIPFPQRDVHIYQQKENA